MTIAHARCEYRVERRDGAVYNLSVAGFETLVTLKDEEATASLGARIAQGLAAGDVVALSGDLGAGKTTLARAILRARGVEGHIPSPTFTLVQAYDTPDLVIHHFDLYRVESARELRELGLDDALEGGAAVIEWPERGMPAYLAEDALSITLEVRGEAGQSETGQSETGRSARISGPERWRSLFHEGAA